VSLFSVIIILVFYPTERKRIKNVINNAERSIIEEDIDALMKNISYNYIDGYGNNYLLLKKRTQMIFRRFDDIEIEKRFKDILINGKEAEVLITTDVMASEGSERGYIIGDAVNPGMVKVYLEKSPHKWKIRRVDIFSESDLGEMIKHELTE
jgi:hypothetical protein